VAKRFTARLAPRRRALILSKLRLLDLGAAALDEEQKHDHSQHASDDSNNLCVVHVEPSFLD